MNKKEECLVSIYCLTYNHKNYIKKCLDGFVMQKTNFKFKAIVYDDCSTDGTREIVQEYADKYPDIIKTIFPHKNIAQSEGYYKINTLMYENMEGKYYAYCEGDDYWCDEYKLQKQVDFLENNPDYSICFHPACVKYEGFDYDKTDELYPSNITPKEATFENLLMQNYIPTSGVVYRWRFHNENFQDWFPKNIFAGDWQLNLLHASVGKIKMLTDVMSVFRKQPKGINSCFNGNIEDLYLAHGLKMLNQYENIYEKITNHSEYFLNNKYIPELSTIIETYLKNRKFEDLKTIADLYPQKYDIAIEKMINAHISFLKKTNRKLEKRKMYYKTLSIFISSIALFEFILLLYLVVIK